MRMNDDKMKGSYNISNIEMEQKRYLPWSPLEQNRFVRKHTYVSCSKSVPRRNKHFVRYNMSKSLNSDKNVCCSSPENSSFEEDKRMSRSSKIMKALNFHTNLSHYGKTKIKRSLNFNLTPSPKRFSCAKKHTQKALRLSPLSASNKLSDLVKDSNDCANNSFAMSSTDSIDENQNETPLRRHAIQRETLHYSTPNAKLNTKSLFSVNSTPLLRGQLEKSIANIVRINPATPVSQSLKCIQGSSKRFDNSMTNTSRNLFHEFHDDDDDDRPQTPENVISIIPESMSAIKRSHKKEKSSRRSGYCVMQLTDSSPDLCGIEGATELVSMREKEERKPRMERSSLDNSENDISDTGSLFDYTEESKFGEESNRTMNCDIIVPLTNCPERDVKDTTSHGSVESISETVEFPEVTADAVSEPETSVTSQNRIHSVRRDADDVIKRSYKMNKEANQTKLYGMKIVQHKVKAVKVENETDKETITKPTEDIVEDKLVFTEESCPDISERACTPEKVNSSRLLLSQFSSVKKSHKKDKHANILSGFQKRQEYFNKEMDSARYSKTLESDVDVDIDVGVQEVANLTDSSCSLDVSSDKLSPSKRKIPLDEFLEHDTSVSCDSDIQDCDIFQNEFQIFTPLKRKRSLITSNIKEYLHFYNLPSGKDEYTEADLANVNLSRCLTPILNIQEHCELSTKCQSVATGSSGSNESETLEIQNYDLNDKTGRSTPKNMSTTELYSNLDSIKKSHKKNKRGSNSRKLSFNQVKNNAIEKGDWQNLSTEIGSDSYENYELSQSDSERNDICNDSTSNEDNNNVQGSSRIDVNEQTAEISLQNVTPPNCLKTKNYIKLLQETSIKRSHKKIRDQRKYKESIEPNQLSDDGSLYGDGEKLLDTESA
ncbi:uncharacterized protein LOC144473975 [Augochlora pura]